MSEWKECKLGDVITLQRGHDLPKSKMKEGNIPVAGSNGIIGYHNQSTTKGSGITIGRSGNIGNAYLYKVDFWAHNTTLYVKDFKGNFEVFIYYFLKNINFKQFNAGSAVPTLNRNHIHPIQVKIPPLPEQRAIASVLSSLDDKIDLLHRQNRTLEAIAETLFRQWFMEEADEGWEQKKIEDFVEVMRGLSYKGSGLTTEGSGVPMHNLNSVYEGGDYKYEGIKYYKGDFKNRHKVFPGDVIITNTEQGHDLLLIGYPAIIPKYFGNEGIFSQHIYRLRIFDERITTQYLYYLLMSYDVRMQITGATNGSTVNMLAKNGIEWAAFKLPSKNLIENFSLKIQQYWDKKELNFLQIRTLEKLRDTLLPKLMSGKVKVKYENS